MLLVSLGQIDFDAGFGAQTLRAESTWLILTRTCRLVAVDVEQAVVRYVIALPGASTYSKMIVIGDRVIVSRSCDDAYVLLAYALADGRELWRTTLPQKLRLVYEAFLVEHAAALTVLIRTQAFRIDPATGSLLVHVTLPDESAQTATPTGSDRVYVRYRNSFGFLAPDLRAEQLLDESLLEVVAANDQLFVLPRLDDYVAVWDAIEARETARIATRPLGADVQALAPLPGVRGRLALRLTNATVAAVLDVPAARLVWKSRMQERFLADEDGFRVYEVTPVQAGVVVTLWSAGSNEEASVLCDSETGEELFSFGIGKLRHGPAAGAHLVCHQGGVRLYTHVEPSPDRALARRSGSMTVVVE